MKIGINLKDNVQDTAIKWLTCEREGLTKEQKKEFDSWLETDISHKEAYDDAKNIYSLFQNMPKEYSQELSNKAHEGARRTKLIENFKLIISYAAAVMLIIVAFFNSYNYFIPSFGQTLVSENKNISKKLLPDGSIVNLDIKTKMQIEYYKNKRIVSLSTGQAMFDVAKDKRRPFIIDSGKTRIEVLGTKFEVINLNDSTTIKVEEGVVKVGHIFNKNKEAQVIGLLKKGQEIQINNLGKVLYSGKTSISEIAPWRNKELIFNKTTIREALNKFARYEDIQFSFKNSNIQNKLFSGKFYTYELDKFLNSLEKIYPIKIKKEENQVFIYKD